MPEIDPGLREFHARTSADYARLARESAVSVEARRAAAERVREPWRRGGPRMYMSETFAVGELGTTIRIHRPTGDRPLPALIYLHGGGWTLFSIDTHDRLMREYAARSGCAVVGVEYSLSPEARFPRALNEVISVCRWVRSDGARHELEPGPLAIGGDSAGANLAVAAAMALRDAGHGVDGLLLNYGAFDPAWRSSHGLYGSDDYMLTSKEMADFWRNYLGSEPEKSAEPLARPLLGDLVGLPPTYLCIAECDILLDENLEMADRLQSAGVEATAKVYSGATHSFLEAVEVSALAGRAIEEGADWLRIRMGL